MLAHYCIIQGMIRLQQLATMTSHCFCVCRSVLDCLGCNKPLLAYPNSGEGYISAQAGWNNQPDLSPEEFGAAALQWAQLGAALIGGCCRTTPEHIHSIAMHLAK